MLCARFVFFSGGGGLFKNLLILCIYSFKVLFVFVTPAWGMIWFDDVCIYIYTPFPMG